MANTSRDTFRLTNAMHQLATGDVVAGARHYISTRQQQGVPMLDADWNELEDMRRMDFQLHLRHFFGNGIPSGSDAFRIGPVTADNDFAIGMGPGLVEGWSVINLQADLTYLGQAAALGVTVPPLSAPTTGMREDLVYLDAWEEETPGAGAPRADGRLIHPLIGLETCTRLERRWMVRVATGISDPLIIVVDPGHVILPLARVQRVEGEPRIRANRIFDLRRTDINVAKYLKVPVRVERGPDLVDSPKLADLLKGLRDIFGMRLEGNDLFVETVTDHDRAVVYFAVQHIAQICSTGELQARTNALTESDALEVMNALAAAQDAFLDMLEDHGDAGLPATAFINDYRAHLDGGSTLDGVTPFLADDDLIGAYRGQQLLNAWLSAPVGTLPEGNVAVEYIDVDPLEALQAGEAYTFTVQFTSGVTSDETEEIFDVFVTLGSDLWAVSPQTTEITLANGGGQDTLDFVVVPSAANVQCAFQVTARARRNPAIQSTQPGLLLEIGAIPDIGAILLYTGPALNTSDQMEIAASALSSGFGTPIPFGLSNRTSSSHNYTLQWWITLDAGSDTGWTPIESAKSTNVFPVPAETVGSSPLAVGGPAVVGQTGTVHVILQLIDGSPPTPDQAASLDIDFIAV